MHVYRFLQKVRIRLEERQAINITFFNIKLLFSCIKALQPFLTMTCGF